MSKVDNTEKRAEVAVDIAGIPANLKAREQWMCWRYQNGRKIPIDAKTGHAGKSNDPETWAPFDVAATRMESDKSLSGIAFVFTADDPFTGVDLDSCREPESGELSSWAKEIVSAFGSYCEVSPSGTGVKLICLAKKPSKSRCQYKVDEEGTSTKAAQIEIYDCKRFWCITGCVVPGFETVADGQQTLDEFVRKRTPPPRGASSDKPNVKPIEPIAKPFASPSAPRTTYERMLESARRYAAKVEPKGEGERNMTAFSLAGHLYAFMTEDTHERLTDSDLTEIVESWNANNSPPLEAVEIKIAIESALNSDTPREDKIVSAFRSKRTKDESGIVVLEEIDIENIIRPERIVLPELSGVGVPTKVRTDDGIQTRHVLYLRWADGRREQRPLEQILATDKATYFVQPYPPTSETATAREWSRASRIAWHDGSLSSPTPNEVFMRLCERIHYFIDFPKDKAIGTVSTVAIWILLTYFYHAWPAVPYLYFGGPKGSGKSRVFEILERLAFRSYSTSNISAASVFRTLDSRGGTLIYDEAERLKDRSSDQHELLSMLLAGYKRGGSATRMEKVGDKFKTVQFDVYGPKAIACIQGLPPALGSRAIRTMMFRTGKDSQKPRRKIDADPTCWQELRDQLYVLALERGVEVLHYVDRDDVCPPMSGRDYELWQPLLALAAWIEDSGMSDLLPTMQDHAKLVIHDSQDETADDQDETLLRILAECIQLGKKPQPKDILEQAKLHDPGFSSWSPKAVATHLRRYEVITNKSNGKKIYSQTSLAQLVAIETNYGMDLGLDSDEDVF